MTRFTEQAAKAWAKAALKSSRPMWMAQAETMAVSPDVAAEQWERIEVQLEADIGAALECAATAKEVSRERS
jgi:succinylarginine dihydrolase